MNVPALPKTISRRNLKSALTNVWKQATQVKINGVKTAAGSIPRTKKVIMAAKRAVFEFEKEKKEGWMAGFKEATGPSGLMSGPGAGYAGKMVGGGKFVSRAVEDIGDLMGRRKRSDAVQAGRFKVNPDSPNSMRVTAEPHTRDRRKKYIWERQAVKDKAMQVIAGAALTTGGMIAIAGHKATGKYGAGSILQAGKYAARALKARARSAGRRVANTFRSEDTIRTKTPNFPVLPKLTKNRTDKRPFYGVNWERAPKHPVTGVPMHKPRAIDPEAKPVKGEYRPAEQSVIERYQIMKDKGLKPLGKGYAINKDTGKPFDEKGHASFWKGVQNRNKAALKKHKATQKAVKKAMEGRPPPGEEPQ